MARGVVVLLLLALVLTGGHQPLHGQETPEAREFIVKFKPGTAGERTALQAMQDQGGQAVLFADFATALGREIGIPLRIATVTSGRELVIGVDADMAAAQAIDGLRRRPDVVRAAVIDAGDGSRVMPRNPVIAVEFAADSAIAGSHSLNAPELRALIDAIAGETGIALLPQASAITFTLEIAALSRRLGQRLGARGDVEYMQPVVLLQPQ